MKHTLTRRGLLAAAAAGLAAPAFVRAAGASALAKVTYQTGWLPQPDKGGLYQAQALGIYKDHGLDVELRSGGPQLNVSQIFMAGNVDFADSDSTRALNFAKDGLPAVAVAAFGQRPLTVLIAHPGRGHDTLASLKGRPLLVSTVGRQTYFLWLKARYGFTDDQVKPYTYSMAPFIADPDMAMEGFVTSEPYELQRAKVPAQVHVLADNGYQAYSNLTLAQPRLVAEQPELVQRFVDATAKGWASYLREDPRPANELMRKGNPELTDDKVAFALAALKQYGICTSDDVAKGGYGAMSDARWKAIYEGLVAAGAMPAGVDPRKAYTLRFVNKRAAVA